MDQVTISRELLQQAIDAFDRIDAWLKVRHVVGLMPQEVEIATKLRNALEQPVQEPVAWHLSKDGLPPVGYYVIGGCFHVDRWLKDETPEFLWGRCFVLETNHPDFKDGKQWHTFGPSHNQITHWCWPPTPPRNDSAFQPRKPSHKVVLLARQDFSHAGCPDECYGCKHEHECIHALDEDTVQQEKS